MEKDNIENASNVIVGVIMVAILLAVGLFIVTLIVSSSISINNDLRGKNYTTVSVANETGFANYSGYTLTGASAFGFKSPTIVKLYNRTDNTVLANGNVTVSDAGVVKNASIIVLDNLSITYTYQYDTTATTEVNVAFGSVSAYTVGMVVAFFELMPTVGTILAVCVLVAGIVILVLYVKKMKDKGTTEDFTG